MGGRLGGFPSASAEPQQFPMAYGAEQAANQPTTRSSLPPRGLTLKAHAGVCSCAAAARVLRRCVLLLLLLLINQDSGEERKKKGRGQRGGNGEEKIKERKG